MNFGVTGTMRKSFWTAPAKRSDDGAFGTAETQRTKPIFLLL